MKQFLSWCRYGAMPHVTFFTVVLGIDLALCVAVMIWKPEAFSMRYAAALGYTLIASMAYSNLRPARPADMQQPPMSDHRWPRWTAIICALAWPVLVVDKMWRTFRRER